MFLNLIFLQTTSGQHPVQHNGDGLKYEHDQRPVCVADALKRHSCSPDQARRALRKWTAGIKWSDSSSRNWKVCGGW